ncbi:hypothetical protein KM043_014679 [Ampulex compressa]|nr:hypothetical protein KM043_014679 [Ampulex compressa]
MGSRAELCSISNEETGKSAASLRNTEADDPSRQTHKSIKIKEEETGDEIREYAATTMSELLGWYGTKGGQLAPMERVFVPKDRPGRSSVNETSSSAFELARLPLPYSAEALRSINRSSVSPSSISQPTQLRPTSRFRREDYSPSSCSDSLISCSWCGRISQMREQGLPNALPYDMVNAVGQFCSEACFAAGRRAVFKRARTCDWCRHVRNPVSYVDFQDGESQLQFCSDKCLNQYKMNIFCHETQAHLTLHGLDSVPFGDSSKGGLITPELWLRNCHSPSHSSTEETSNPDDLSSVERTELKDREDANEKAEKSKTLKRRSSFCIRKHARSGERRKKLCVEQEDEETNDRRSAKTQQVLEERRKCRFSSEPMRCGVNCTKSNMLNSLDQNTLSCSKSNIANCSNQNTLSCSKSNIFNCSEQNTLSCSKSNLQNCSKSSMLDCSHQNPLNCPNSSILNCSKSNMLDCPNQSTLSCSKSSILNCSKSNMDCSNTLSNTLSCSKSSILNCSKSNILNCSKSNILNCSDPSSILNCSRSGMLNCSEPNVLNYSSFKNHGIADLMEDVYREPERPRSLHVKDLKELREEDDYEGSASASSWMTEASSTPMRFKLSNPHAFPVDPGTESYPKMPPFGPRPSEPQNGLRSAASSLLPPVTVLVPYPIPIPIPIPIPVPSMMLEKLAADKQRTRECNVDSNLEDSTSRRTTEEDAKLSTDLGFSEMDEASLRIATEGKRCCSTSELSEESIEARRSDSVSEGAIRAAKKRKRTSDCGSLTTTTKRRNKFVAA